MRNAVLLVLFTIAFSASVFAFSYDIYKTKDVCEANNGFWCYRCQGNGENAFGIDTCVQSNLNCSYGCSTVCGADCSQNSQCAANLTSSSCQYAGACSSCNCVYNEEYCPQNGTINNGYCYFGARSCGYSGCSVNKCLLLAGEVCDPANGCVPGSGNIGEIYEDYRCVGNDVYAKKTLYVCNATACGYSKYDTFVERCNAGCIDGKCDDGTCNLNGLVFDCNRLDGYYGNRFCIGSSIYRTYKNYSCSGNACGFAETQVFQEHCGFCENGACVTREDAPLEEKTQKNRSADDVQQPQKTLVFGKKIYNGWLFGRGDLVIETQKGRSGTINFTIAGTNNFGALSVVSGTNALYYGKPEKGTMSLQFTDSSGSIIFMTSSSGWLFFSPATYDIRYVIVEYR